jgi:hypothetical protein
MDEPSRWGAAGIKKGFGGNEMKHFTTEEWIDFVNQAASYGKQHQMQSHLDTGCKPCAKAVSLWQKVQQSAAVEKNYQPPTETLRVVKAAFAGSSLARQRRAKRSAIEVLFDSFSQPVLEGTRSAGFGARQMLYRADPYQIDVHLEAKPDGNRLVVTGQLLNLSHAEIVGRDVQVMLSNRRGNVVRTVTNQFGEFQGELENNGDLELSFPGPGEKPIVISLRDALGRIPGARQ